MIRTEHLFTDPKGPFARKPENMAPIVNSHGASLFGRLLLPGLESPEERSPLVIFLHGYPGGEQNIDLAQALRRAGYFVIYFWYRGVWGSHGNYSFSHLIEDVHTVVDYVRSGKTGLPINTDEIYLFGHSMGGFAVLNALATGLQVKKVFLLAPCNICHRQLFEKEKLAGLTQTKDSGYYRLERYTILEDELDKNEHNWYFPNLVERLPRDIPYTILCGLQDTVCPAETHVRPMLEKMEALGFDVNYMERDDGHSFHASRLWLAETVVRALQER